MVRAPLFTLRAAHLDASPLEDVNLHAIPVVDGLTRQLHSQFVSFQYLPRPHTLIQTVTLLAIARWTQTFPALIHVTYRCVASHVLCLIVAIFVRWDALTVRTVGTPLANRLVVFVIRPLRQTFRACPEGLAFSARHPVRIAEYSVRSLRLSHVDVTLVTSVA